MKFSELADLLHQELGEDQGRRIVTAICVAFSSETVYIPQYKKPPDIKPTDTPATVARRFGVSRQTGYNWVNRWRR
jgi:hypothetical protein